MAFVKATKKQAKLRMAIHGPSGSGKTRSALEIGRHLVPGGKLALVDTEHGSASKYSDICDFDVMEVTADYNPEKVGHAIKEAADAGYDTIIFDSLTHFWNGAGGFLELVDREVDRQKARGGRGDSFAAWKVIDPIYRRMVQAILSAPLHVIVTLRAKTEYDRSNGKVEKVGLAPEIRDTFQYEMDVEGMLTIDHKLAIGKTRCEAIDGGAFPKPGRDVADILRKWLTDGAPVVEVQAPTPVAAVDWERIAVSAKWAIDNAETIDDLRTIRAELPAKLPKGEAPEEVRKAIGAHLASRERAITATDAA